MSNVLMQGRSDSETDLIYLGHRSRRSQESEEEFLGSGMDGDTCAVG